MTDRTLWTPSSGQIANANISQFIKYVNSRQNLQISSWEELYDYSVNEIERFWEDLFHFSAFDHSGELVRILSERKMPGARWFEGIKLSYAKNVLQRLPAGYCITSRREGFPVARIKSDDLCDVSLKLASAFLDLGVKEGDRIAAFSANLPETIAGFLATSLTGAIWSSCSPDFGTSAVIDRFGQIEPVILIASESYQYGGKTFDLLPKINEIVDGIPSIRKVILIPAYSDFSGNETRINTSLPENCIYLNDLIANQEEPGELVDVDFSHPLYILYSSGTTGKPKCIVHGTGGVMLQHFKELYLHTDLKPGDKLLYYTTTGWMMWNWLISGLLTGSEVVLFDGSVIYPDDDVLWKFVANEEINVFGTSPKFLSLSEKNGLQPGKSYNISKLRTILSTGSPLVEHNYDFVYSRVKPDIQLSSISGGTDIVSCFMLGNPLLPVVAGEIQCRGLGMKVEVFDAGGNSLEDKKGELVCTAPFPSMPLFFWDDLDGVKYHKAYFDQFPGVWRHGDFIRITRRGGIVVYGRSDATLNPGGVRIGTAEIYRIVEELPEIADSIVGGVKVGDDVEIFLFIVLASGLELTPDLTIKIKKLIREKASPRHVPHRIMVVPDIPRTISGKKVEIAVSRIFEGEEPDNREALANPDILDHFIYLAGKSGLGR